jgi:hypothetical protein
MHFYQGPRAAVIITQLILSESCSCQRYNLWAVSVPRPVRYNRVCEVCQ